MTVVFCIPTLNRYDLLFDLLSSAEKGTVVPDRYLIIDNGSKFTLSYVPSNISGKITIYSPGENIGVAASWNWFINATWDYKQRLISNDDIVLVEDSVEKLLNCPGDFVFALSDRDVNAFSLFNIRNSCINKVGYFDEDISPKYAYFEDNDYFHRMHNTKADIRTIHSPVIHMGSSTIRNFDDNQERQHHHKFLIARSNYVKKWGGMPGSEVFPTPYNR